MSWNVAAEKRKKKKKEKEREKTLTTGYEDSRLCMKHSTNAEIVGSMLGGSDGLFGGAGADTDNGVGTKELTNRG